MSRRAEERIARAGFRAALACAATVALAGMPGCKSGATAPAPPDMAHASGPVDSDRAVSWNGGGCYPNGVLPGMFDMVALANPQWAPVVNGQTIDSDPILVHGTAHAPHGDTGGDDPLTHGHSDATVELELDPDDQWRAATGNGAAGRLELEWESGTYADWAWAGDGDRIVALGRWIFDCGHPGATPGRCSVSSSQACILDTDCGKPACPTCAAGETCQGAHFGYSSELHPPQAAATIRVGRGAVVSSDPGAKAVPATRVDLLATATGGPAGDRCSLTHQDPVDDLVFGTDCWPLAQPVAPLNRYDFSVDIPLPSPRPDGAAAKWRVVDRDLVPPGGARARLEVVSHESDPTPHLTATLKLTEGAPAGYASTLFAGWDSAAQPALTHVRLTVDALVVRNPLKPATPIVREVKDWRMQAAVNGEWQRMTGLGAVSAGLVAAQGLRFEQWLPPGGTLALRVNGTSSQCIDTLFGIAIKNAIKQLGAGDYVTCLRTEWKDPGVIDLSYPGPDFGAGPSGTKSYETPGANGDGGTCAKNPVKLCVIDPDCGPGDHCAVDGHAFSLRYHIEKLP